MRKIGKNAVRTGATFVALLLTVASLLGWVHLSEQSRTPKLAEIGGPVSLVDHHGKTVTDRDYLGKPTLVFFGLTHCPDVCPSTLLEITDQFKDLGARGRPAECPLHHRRSGTRHAGRASSLSLLV
jgi:cytochrome oxidase Cu insertion factor (SCO1/SenC/PrrC family)